MAKVSAPDFVETELNGGVVRVEYSTLCKIAKHIIGMDSVESGAWNELPGIYKGRLINLHYAASMFLEARPEDKPRRAKDFCDTYLFIVEGIPRPCACDECGKCEDEEDEEESEGPSPDLTM